MSFELSQRSLERLEGVEDSLVLVVKRAIQLTKVDFGVSEGLRSVPRQMELVARGASKTMKSKHIDGLAVDLVAYISGRVSWELNLYDDIADAMAAAAKEHGAIIRWGGAWHIDDIGTWQGKMEDAMTTYIDLRRSQGKRPFIDGPHFELM
jgi:peptidoglycan L-alanyl-D-glutamate endopeptidase CwlK